MEIGVRVVRGPDWNYNDQDGGDGHLGTVVGMSGQSDSSLPDKCAMVLWDSGAQYQYRIGSGDKYDLYVLDSASLGVKYSVVCDGCKNEGLVGLRWKCSRCGDYNLCTRCYMSDKHDLMHEFVRFDNATSQGFSLPSRGTFTDKKVEAVGIFKGAIVSRGPNWMWGDQDGGAGYPGEVIEDKEMIIVRWAVGRVGDYRLGAEGQVDLKCLRPASGGRYYKTHLPVLGKNQVADSASASDSLNLELPLDMAQLLLNPLLGLGLASGLGLPKHTGEITQNSYIREGLRVCRGPDWKWAKQDKGEGHLGTVIVINPLEKCAYVLWDTGDICNYRVGRDDAYDLRLLDSGAAGIFHKNVECQGCQDLPVYGTLWRCEQCEDYKLCGSCYHSDKHDLTHKFLRIDKHLARPVPVSPRKGSLKVEALGLFPGSTVQRGKNWKWGDTDGGSGKEGTVVKIKKWTPETRRSRADVKWTDDDKTLRSYRCGHKGKVDLKCMKSTSGGMYYRDHLPIVGKKEKAPTKFTFGDKVNIIQDVDNIKYLQEDYGGWNDGMLKYMKKVGTVQKIDDFGLVTVKYEDNKTFFFNQDVLNEVWLNPQREGASSLPDVSQDSMVHAAEGANDDGGDKKAYSQPQCKICMTNDASVAFVPCGHLVSCPQCAEGLDKCPVCRSEIKHWLKTFIQ